MRIADRLLALAAGLACASVALAQDTVYVVRRDTVVLVQRDTLFVVEETSARAGYYRRDDRPQEAVPIEELTDEDIRRMPRGRMRVNARRELLKYRRAVRQGSQYVPSGRYVVKGSAFVPPPDVRTSPHAWAYHTYPTRLLDLDFPAVTFGASYVRQGVFGLTGTLGFLVDPSLFQSQSFRTDDGRFGDPRLGLRGFDLGLEARWLISERYDREPLYIGLGGSYAIAPITITTLVLNEAGTFSRIAEADAAGRRVEGTLVMGWDGRFRNGFALDIALGADLGAKGVFSNVPGALDGWESWETIPNAWNGYLTPVLRIGIGFGRW